MTDSLVERKNHVPFHRSSYRPETKTEPLRSIIAHVKQLLDERFGYDFRQGVPGTAVYPPGGGLGWHTNSENPGRRVYCIWAEENQACFFRAYDQANETIETLHEPSGWSIRSFVIPEPPEALWHCVSAGSHRFALGLRCFTTE